ncbi:hypothetical protein [Phytohabitans aurantiacus]|uniref:PNPLA domain-containing protein n=1 Tax=Phytohabitans aurantiacus TaxID=3016789 RepID=A0ABQ5R5T6_9ACTN|nr:hypothetical protein [Phytohabitans aurantiacus]GLI02144.1 hypothetical protein Pa4123_74220 [Phytohabitans aurantiacus]
MSGQSPSPRWSDLRRRLGLLGILVITAVPAIASALMFERERRRPWIPPELSDPVAAVGDLARGGDDLFILLVEFGLATGFAATGAVAGVIGAQRLLSAPGRRAARTGAAAAALAWVSAVAAKVVLLYAADRADAGVYPGVAQGLTFVMVACFAWSVVVAVVVLATLASRVVRDPRDRRAVRPDDVHPGECAATTTANSWTENWRLPPGRGTWPPSGIGVCMSGGGIRSAAFGLGALQVLQERGVLKQARELVAVSGGGYAAGAMRLAMAGPGGAPAPERAGDAFAAGSPEFDHVRRKSKYLAETTGEWLRALAVLLRGFVVAQLTLVIGLILTARALGEVYRQAPALARQFTDPAPDGGLGGHPLLPPDGVSGAIAVTLMLAIAAWLCTVVAENWRRSSSGGVFALIRASAKGLAVLGAGMATIAVVIPLLVRLSAEALRWYQGQDAVQSGAPSAAANAATVATAGYLAAVAGIFLTVGRLVRPAVGWAWAKRDMLRAVPVALLQWVLVIAGTAALVLGYLFVFTRVLADSVRAEYRWPDGWPGFGQNWHFALLAGALLFLGWLVDQTRWSLHPFYRRRLMTAFAVRRSADGTAAEPYDFDKEATPLEKYASTVEGFPRVTFLTAANVSGSDLTPPGRRALPYTLSGDWIGCPRLGWIRTRQARRLGGYPVEMDLTTQAAMAISGAAFASAMGASAMPFSLLFTLTNARLGTWLPNPRFLCRHRADDPGGPVPGIPQWRRLPYFFREIFGIYPPDSKMLLVTDGGHYENLGLVELLRQAPAVVYCFDASGGRTLTASALGPAITLARQELGIDITFDAWPRVLSDPDALTPGSAKADPVPAGLTGRLATSAVLVARITYPDLKGDGNRPTGTLYFGRAILTPDTPWPVLAYASDHPVFPNDSTSDQWFDSAQFDAYHALGRHVATRVLAAASPRPAAQQDQHGLAG